MHEHPKYAPGPETARYAEVMERSRGLITNLKVLRSQSASLRERLERGRDLKQEYSRRKSQVEETVSQSKRVQADKKPA
jgi:hypothetical protein